MSASISITPIKAFNDNYIWCIHDDQNAVVVDPGDPAPVQAFMTDKNLQLTDILITHHHYDHTGGVLALKESFPEVAVIGPFNPVIKGLTKQVLEGDQVAVLNNTINFNVMQTPGHTMDHIAFYNPQWLFCGDTLFSAGCGRMFEGTPDVFLASLDKLASLPAQTKVYCTHEYTLANLKFARYLLPEHQTLLEYEQWAQQQRANKQITLPSTIAQQRDINPFLLCHNTNFQSVVASKLNQNIEGPVDTFAAIRAAKDNF